MCIYCNRHSMAKGLVQTLVLERVRAVVQSHSFNFNILFLAHQIMVFILVRVAIKRSFLRLFF